MAFDDSLYIDFAGCSELSQDGYTEACLASTIKPPRAGMGVRVDSGIQKA
jgi:hypothetical protein